MTATDPQRDYRLQLHDGRTVCYHQYGCATGRPVLALHGTPGSRLKFLTAHAAALRHDLRLIAPDRWAYGGTSAHPAPALSAYCADAGELMRACAAERFAVLGVSGGGPFAAAVAAGLVDRVSRAALVAPVGLVTDAGVRRRMSLFHRFCFAVLPRIPGATRIVFAAFGGLARAAPAAAISLATLRAGQPDRELMRADDKRLSLGQTFAEGLRPGAGGPVVDLELFSRPWDFAPADIRGPARLWIGSDDRNVPIAAAVAMADAIPACELTRLAGHGHLWISGNIDPVLAWLANGD